MKCPVCSESTASAVFTALHVPVLANALAPTREEAEAARTGEIELCVCHRCGLIRNSAFDPDRVTYTPAYHNSLHGSPTFRRYAEALARRLVDDYGVRGGHVVEVGAGGGDFLELLCRTGGNRGTGFDPSHAGGSDAGGGLAIAVATYAPETAPAADLVVCQHVLEHVADPLTLLAAFPLPASGDAVPCYIEVPDAAYMVESTAVFDVVYEHCSYFSAPPLRRALSAAGLEVLATGTAYGGQYLWADALRRREPSSGAALHAQADAGSDEVAAVAAARRFGTQARELVARWRERLEAMAREGPVVLWGAGTKGVMFSVLADPGRLLTAAVDVNDRKHGLYLPVSAVPVVAPRSLEALAPAHVLVMNPLYEDEVRAALTAIGVQAQVTVV